MHLFLFDSLSLFPEVDLSSEPEESVGNCCLCFLVTSFCRSHMNFPASSAFVLSLADSLLLWWHLVLFHSSDISGSSPAPASCAACSPCCSALHHCKSMRSIWAEYFSWAACLMCLSTSDSWITCKIWKRASSLATFWSLKSWMSASILATRSCLKSGSGLFSCCPSPSSLGWRVSLTGVKAKLLSVWVLLFPDDPGSPSPSGRVWGYDCPK